MSHHSYDADSELRSQEVVRYVLGQGKIMQVKLAPDAQQIGVRRMGHEGSGKKIGGVDEAFRG